jgi:hypothetical protein
MGVLALTSAFIYMGPLDFTGSSDELLLRAEAQTPECTTWRSNRWREYKQTLKTSMLSSGGFWSCSSANDVDPEFFNNLGTGGQVVTAGLQETEGEIAHIMRKLPTQVSFFEGSVGDLSRAKIEGAGSDGSIGQIRGKLFKAFGTVTGTGATGTGIQLGAISADQSLYGTLHTFGTPGSSITAIVQSDDNSGFTTPTTRATFNGGSITTAAGFWLTPVAGAISDDWWRLSISAISGTWVIASALAIRTTNP